MLLDFERFLPIVFPPAQIFIGLSIQGFDELSFQDYVNLKEGFRKALLLLLIPIYGFVLIFWELDVVIPALRLILKGLLIHYG